MKKNSSSLLIITALFVFTLSACGKITGNEFQQVVETPTLTPTTVPTFSPDSCTGRRVTISGAIYNQGILPGNELEDITVAMRQISWCSPTSGQYQMASGADGKFEFPVFVHDTDTFWFEVEMDGYEPLKQSIGGFECLSGSCPPVELVLKPIEAPTELAQSWQMNIDQLNDLLNSQEIPQHLLIQEPLLRGDEFDIMKVFDILDHISMVDGYKLAYVYSYDSMGSFPRLYAQAVDIPPFTSPAQFMSAQPECFQSDEKPLHCDHMQNVKTDDSELGYLQWVLLYVMGPQFYLDWHANIKNTTFIATNEALDQLVTQLSETSFGFPMIKAEADKAKAIDPSPLVSINDKTVSVRVVWFTKWGGFYKTQHILSRTFPHTILETNISILQDYNCGVVY